MLELLLSHVIYTNTLIIWRLQISLMSQPADWQVLSQPDACLSGRQGWQVKSNDLLLQRSFNCSTFDGIYLTVNKFRKWRK